MPKVLITGATGFIGQHCLKPLLNKGFELHGITSRSSPLRCNAAANIQWYPANLLDVAQISRLMQAIQPTHLLHLAWCVTPAEWATSLDNFAWVQSSLEILRQFYETGGKRAVLIGSDAEYDIRYGFCSESQTPLHPDTLYGSCKASLSTIVQAYTQQAGFSCAWARLFSLYGPHEHPRRLVPIVTRALLTDQLACCSHGQQIRDFLYVQDAADALVALLESEITGAINIASGQPVALETVIMTIAQQLQREDLVRLGAIVPKRQEAPLIVADVRRLHHILGWQPQFSLATGIAQTIDWWKGQLDDDVVANH